MAEENSEVIENSGSNNEVQQEQEHIDIGLDQFKHENGKIFGKFDDPVAFGNAYRELEKMNTKNSQDLASLRKANTAPDKYEIKIDDDLAEDFQFDENSPEYQTYLPVFKELGLSNDKVNKLVNAYARDALSQNDIDYDAEIQKVGGENGEIMTTINGFVAKNPDLKEFLQNKVQTAEDAQAVAKLIKATRGTVSIPETTKHENSYETKLSKQEYKDAAFDYQQKHKDSIRYNEAEQQEYMRLLSLGL